MIRECKIHGLIEHRSRTEYGRNKGWICKKCNSEATTRSKRKRKADSVAYKGGKCEICGYDKCQDALEFHHIDDTKSFNIGIHGYRMTFEELKKELDKCQLLCANCHREVHFKLTTEN